MHAEDFYYFKLNDDIKDIKTITKQISEAFSKPTPLFFLFSNIQLLSYAKESMGQNPSTQHIILNFNEVHSKEGGVSDVGLTVRGHEHRQRLVSVW